MNPGLPGVLTDRSGRSAEQSESFQCNIRFYCLHKQILFTQEVPKSHHLIQNPPFFSQRERERPFLWVHLFVQVRQKALECAQRRKRCMQMEKRIAEMTTNAEEQIQNCELKCGLVKGVGTTTWPQGLFNPLEGVKQTEL